MSAARHNNTQKKKKKKRFTARVKREKFAASSYWRIIDQITRSLSLYIPGAFD